MNNQYHRFVRIPKGIANAVAFDLRMSFQPDALDVFEYLINLTHHNSFESKMIYRGQLIGIQRRLNKVLKSHGYRLKSCHVPVGIQKAHKVDSNEKRWGFEPLKVGASETRTSVSQILRQLKVQQREAEKSEKILRAFKLLSEPEPEGSDALLNEWLEQSKELDGLLNEEQLNTGED